MLKNNAIDIEIKRWVMSETESKTEMVWVPELGRGVEMKWVDVECMGRKRIQVPVRWGDVPEGEGRSGWLGVLEQHMKKYRPKHYRRLRETGELEGWLREQVKGLLDAAQEMTETTTARIPEILEILLPLYIYLESEHGLEFL